MHTNLTNLVTSVNIIITLKVLELIIKVLSLFKAGASDER